MQVATGVTSVLEPCPPLPTGVPGLLRPTCPGSPSRCLSLQLQCPLCTPQPCPTWWPRCQLVPGPPRRALSWSFSQSGVFRLRVAYGQMVSVREALQRRPSSHEDHRPLDSPLCLPPCLSVCVPPLRLVGSNNTGGATTAHRLGHRDHASHPSPGTHPCVSASCLGCRVTRRLPLRWD